MWAGQLSGQGPPHLELSAWRRGWPWGVCPRQHRVFWNSVSVSGEYQLESLSHVEFLYVSSADASVGIYTSLAPVQAQLL